MTTPTSEPTPAAVIDWPPTILASMNQGFCVLEMIRDPSGQAIDYRFVATNAAFERHTGLHSAVGRTALELVPDLERHWIEAYDRVAVTGQTTRFEQGSIAMGRVFEVEAMRVGEPSHATVALLFRDVTDRLRAEDELRKREASLREALAVKDQFLGVVSHELRTPMTIILGMSRLLADTLIEPGRMREVAADIAESAEVLNELVEAMLLLARVDQHEGAQLREPVLLHRLTETAVRRARARDGGREWRLRVVDRDLVVDVQRTWLERAIENLLSNAAKYSPAGSPVEAVVEAAGSDARLRVLDRGLGIDPGEAEHVFDAFYRSPSVPTGVAGIGLGLAVVKRVITLSDGRVWAAARPGGGTELAFELPLASAVEHRPPDD